MGIIEGYEHRVASHCETGSVRNLLAFHGADVTEPMVFGVGSGLEFFYLFFAKGPSTFPLIGLRNKPGAIWENIGKLDGIDLFSKQYPTTADAMRVMDKLVDRGVPVAISVDMFYMKYLPSFLHVHAPFHFVIILGRMHGRYVVSDPYSEVLGELTPAELKTAWATNAPMARDNFLAHLKGRPVGVDWPGASLEAIKRTCNHMLMPPVVRKLFGFMGIQGMRMYARKIREWPKVYRGIQLREGILFNAIAFEDQGTGGGAFRFMYGSFLQEAADLLGSGTLGDMGTEMVKHGDRWRQLTRLLIRAGKLIPTEEGAYRAWYSSNKRDLADALDEAASHIEAIADTEQRFFGDLRDLAATL